MLEHLMRNSVVDSCVSEFLLALLTSACSPAPDAVDSVRRLVDGVGEAGARGVPAEPVVRWHEGPATCSLLIVRVSRAEVGSDIDLIVHAPHMGVQSSLSGFAPTGSSRSYGFGKNDLRFSVTPSNGLPWDSVGQRDDIEVDGLEFIF